MSQTLFDVPEPDEELAPAPRAVPSASTPRDPSHPGQMRLSRLQVANWGTFDGFHDLSVPRLGLLLTGESGSGKSSLLDAMSAVLVKPGEARFNAAAQDGPGGDRDRSPMSYVRGAYRKESSEETGEVRPGYLRPHATWSGISLTFGNARGDVFSAVRLFHIGRGASTAAELRTAYLTFDADFDLAEAEPHVASGIDRRRLKTALSPATISDTYPKFGSTLRRRTGIPSQAAQRLLHRTQAAKNLTSLDLLLRDFMLEEPETFTLAEVAVEQFGALRDAHEAVIDARAQMEVLSPMRELWAVRGQALSDARRLEALTGGIDGYQHTKMIDLAKKVLDRAEREQASARASLTSAQEATTAALDAWDRARSTRDDRGGSELRELSADILRSRERRTAAASQVERMRPVFSRLGADVPAAAEELLTAQQQARRENYRIEQDAEQLEQEALPHRLDAARAQEEITQLESEVSSLLRRTSNLPRRQVEARDQIAEMIGVGSARLPFVGELMDVVDPDWRGAVERVLRSLAQTILVPSEHYLAVAEAVDSRHWDRTRLEYERVLLDGGAPAREPRSDGLVRTLRLVDGPFRPWLLRRLIERFDHVLVETPQELARHDRAVTRNGQLRLGERHVKDDRFRVDDPSRWIIGTSNAARIDLLRGQLEEATQARDRAHRQLRALHDAHRDFRERTSAHDQVLRLEWADIDLPGAEAALGALEERERALLASGDLAELADRVDRAHRALERAREEERAADGALLKVEHTIQGAQARLQEAQKELGDTVVDPDVYEELDRCARTIRRSLDPSTLLDLVSKMRIRLADEKREAEGTAERTAAWLQAARRRFLEGWAERSANLVDDIAATEDFLRVLERLEADRLPEFEARFRELLRTQSQNNIANLAAAISQAIRDVRHRLEPVNESLRATPFDTAREHWLTLVARPQQSGEVREFLAELQEITQHVFSSSEESLAQAETRFERIRAVMDRLGSAESTHVSWRGRVLDTRRHVTFEAHEIAADGQVADVYKGSDGRSGGQRQRLVTFCLAAALRYQLTDSAAGTAPYGLVVLDEAFDKTDIQFTRAGLEVFRSFGFQLLLATPLKMLQTIEEFVGGAAVVTNPSGRASALGTATYVEED